MDVAQWAVDFCGRESVSVLNSFIDLSFESVVSFGFDTAVIYSVGFMFMVLLTT